MTTGPVKNRICCRCQAFYAGRDGDRWCPDCKPWMNWVNDPGVTVEELKAARAIIDLLMAKVKSGVPLAAAVEQLPAEVAAEALGRCNSCKEPTSNPVAFYTHMVGQVGRFGHYYCERCGPAVLAMANDLGIVVPESQ